MATDRAAKFIQQVVRGSSTLKGAFLRSGRIDGNIMNARKLLAECRQIDCAVERTDNSDTNVNQSGNIQLSAWNCFIAYFADPWPNGADTPDESPRET